MVGLPIPCAWMRRMRHRNNRKGKIVEKLVSPLPKNTGPKNKNKNNVAFASSSIILILSLIIIIIIIWARVCSTGWPRQQLSHIPLIGAHFVRLPFQGTLAGLERPFAIVLLLLLLRLPSVYWKAPSSREGATR